MPTASPTSRPRPGRRGAAAGRRRFAFALFALGIIGTGLLAVPVLAGSAAYAVGEALRLADRPGARRPRGARFYTIIARATLVGVALNFTPLDPIKALFWSAVINGVVAVPIMAIMMRLVTNREVMGRFHAGKRLMVVGWGATRADGPDCGGADALLHHVTAAGAPAPPQRRRLRPGLGLPAGQAARGLVRPAAV